MTDNKFLELNRCFRRRNVRQNIAKEQAVPLVVPTIEAVRAPVVFAEPPVPPHKRRRCDSEDDE